MRKLLWLLLVSAAFAQGPKAALDYFAEGPPTAGVAQEIGSRYTDIKNAQLYICTSTTYANKAYTCNWTNVGASLCTSSSSIVAGSSCYPTIQAAITAAGSGGTVLVPPGTYAPTSTTTISGLDHLTIQFSKGATVTAQAGLGANPVFLITGSSNNITISGAGKIDGASIASQCIGINNAANHITIDGIECTGTTSHGIDARPTASAVTYDVTNITVNNSYIHNVSGHGISLRGKDMTASLNTITTAGQSGVSCAGERLLIHGNSIYDWDETVSTNSGIHCFGANESNISDNKVTGKSPSVGNYAIYCDTCFTTTMARNMIDHSGVGMRAEVPYNNTVQNNQITDVTYTSGSGILFNSRIDPSVINALDSLTGLTAGTNVTLALDAVTKIEGADSVKATIAGGFAGGLIMSQVLGSTQDWSTRPISRIYFQTDTLLNQGVLNLLLYSDAGCSSLVSTIPFPHAAISQWLQEELYDLEWFPKFTTPGIRCWAITGTAAAASTVLHFDNYLIDVPGGTGVIADNNITRTGSIGIQVETTVGPVTVHHNHIDNPGWYNSTGAGSAILLQTGGLNATAGQVISNVWVDNNILRNSMNLSDSGAFGIRGRMLNSGTGTNNYLWLNDISQGFATNDQVFLDGTSGVSNLATLTSNATLLALVWPGTMDIGGNVTQRGTETFQTTTAAVKTSLTVTDNGSTGNNTSIDAFPTSGQDVNIRINRSVNVGAGASLFQWFKSDNSSTTTATMDMKLGRLTLAENAVASGKFISGAVGGVSGEVDFTGLTSGTASITGPAVAGTITNTFGFSNSISMPSGTVIGWNGDVGLSRGSSGNLNCGSSSAGSSSCIFNLGSLAFSIAGSHIRTQAASTDVAGTIAISAATSATHTFSVNYTNAPTCVITPITDPTSVGVWWVSTATSGVTANIKSSGTITFNYICFAATN